MLQHENPNIEIINPNLWAVRFSLIPLIPQISFNPKFDVPLNNVPGQISPSGVMVLNKDFILYPDFKKMYHSVMRMKNRELRQQHLKMWKAEVDTDTISGLMQNLLKFALQIETERRSRKKGR